MRLANPTVDRASFHSAGIFHRYLTSRLLLGWKAIVHPAWSNSTFRVVFCQVDGYTTTNLHGTGLFFSRSNLRHHSRFNRSL